MILLQEPNLFICSWIYRKPWIFDGLGSYKFFVFYVTSYVNVCVTHFLVLFFWLKCLWPFNYERFLYFQGVRNPPLQAWLRNTVRIGYLSRIAQGRVWSWTPIPYTVKLKKMIFICLLNSTYSVDLNEKI